MLSLNSMLVSSSKAIMVTNLKGTRAQPIRPRMVEFFMYPPFPSALEIEIA